MKRKRIIAALLTGTMLCSSIMEPRAMDLSDWSTSSYGRGMGKLICPRLRSFR